MINLPFQNTICIIHSRNENFSVFGLIERFILQVEIGRDPTNIDMSGILTGENSYAVEIFVDETHAFNIQRVEILAFTSQYSSWLYHRT